MNLYVRPDPVANNVCGGNPGGIDECRLVEDCGASHTALTKDATQTTDFVWFATQDGTALNDILQGNADFLGYFTDVHYEKTITVCLKCYDTNRNNAAATRDDNQLLFTSNNFDITFKCPDDIEVDEPETMEYVQVETIAQSPTNPPRFWWNSFRTKTKACPPLEYKISGDWGGGTGDQIWSDEEGIQNQNSYCENWGNSLLIEQNSGACPDAVRSDPTSGNYANLAYNGVRTFYGNILDTVRPYEYHFKIWVQVLGGNKVWFPQFPNSTSSTADPDSGIPVATNGQLATFSCPTGNTAFFGYSVGNSPSGLLDQASYDYGDIEGNSSTTALSCSPLQFGLDAADWTANTAYCYCRSTNQETSYYNYTLKCPTYTPVEPDTPFSSTVLTTFIGASFDSTPSSVYTFQEIKPHFTRCQSVIDYNIINISPAGALTYPSSSCSTIPCRSLDVDVSGSYTSPFTFQVEATTSELIGLGSYTYTTSTLQVVVSSTHADMPQLIASTIYETDALTEDYSTPPASLRATQLQQTHFLIDATGIDARYYISPFTCDLSRAGCRNSDGIGFIDTDNYQLKLSTGTIITTVFTAEYPINSDGLTNSSYIYFTIDTSVLFSDSVKVYAQARDYGNNVVATSSPVTIQVVCGSETVAYDPSITSLPGFIACPSNSALQCLEIVQDKDSGTQTYTLFDKFTTTKNTRCPILNVQREPSVQATHPSLSFTGTLNNQFDCTGTVVANKCGTTNTGLAASITADSQFTYSTSTAFYRESIIIRATSKGSITSRERQLDLTILVTVCGLEQFTLKTLTAAQNTYIWQKGETMVPIVFADDWFIENQATTLTQSHVDCISNVQSSYVLKMGANCGDTIDGTRFTLNVATRTITVVTSNPFAQETVCIQATTNGNVVGLQRLTFEVCGDETVVIQDANNWGSIDKTLYKSVNSTYNETISALGYTNASLTTPFVQSLSYYGFTISSSRANCPLAYQILNNDTAKSLYTGSEIAISTPNGDLTVDISTAFEFTGLIKAFTFGNLQEAEVPIHFTICGYENIFTDSQAMVKTNLRDNGILYTLLKIYKPKFRSNCTADCPIIYYGLSRNASGAPLNYFESQIVWMDDDFNIKFNSSIDFAQDFNETSGGLEYIANYTEYGNMTMPLYIAALTQGMRLFYQPINFTLLNHTYGDYNFPPFLQTEWPIELTILVDPLSPVKYERVYFNVSDAEGDQFSVKILNSFQFIQFGVFNANNNTHTESVYNEIICQSSCELYIQWNFLDYSQMFEGRHSILLQFEDHNKELSQASLPFQIRYLEQNETIMGVCEPLSDIIYYEQICDSSILSSEAFNFCSLVLKPTVKITEPQAFLNKNIVEMQFWSYQSMPRDVFVENYIQFFNTYRPIEERQQLDRIFDISFNFDLNSFQKLIKEQYAHSKCFQVCHLQEAISNSYTEVNGVKMDQQYEGSLCQITIDNRDRFRSAFVQNNTDQFERQIRGIVPDVCIVKCQQGEEDQVQVQRMELLRSELSNEQVLTVKFKHWLPELTLDQIHEIMTGIENSVQIFLQLSIDDTILIEGQDSKEKQSQQPRFLESNLDSPAVINPDDYSFAWKLLHLNSSSIQFQLNFTNKEFISSSPYGYDNLLLTFNDEDVFSPLNSEDIIFKMEKEQSPEVTYVYIKSLYDPNDSGNTEALLYLFAVIMALAFLLAAFSGRGQTGFWSLVNTQQLTIYMICTSVTNVPDNTVQLQDIVSAVNQRELFSTDTIFKSIFNFTKSKSINFNFERNGLKGRNFVELMGTLTITLLVICLILALFQLVHYLCVKFYKHKTARNIGILVAPLATIGTGIHSELMAGYLDIVVCALMTMPGTEYKINRNASDILVFIFAIISIVGAILVPFSHWRALHINRAKMDEPETQDKLGLYYHGLKTTSYGQMLFHVMFTLRRLIFSILLITLYNHGGIQIALHALASILYMIYVFGTKARVYMHQNYLDMFNEYCTLLLIYGYMFFKQSHVKSKQMGKLYNVVFVICMVVNILYICYFSIFPDSKLGVKVMRFKFNNWRYQDWKTKWFADKLFKSKKFPNSSFAQYRYQESLKIYDKMTEKKIAFSEGYERYKHVNWLLKNNLPLDCLPAPYMAYPQLDDDIVLEQNYEYIEDRIRLGTINLVDGQFPHNQIDGSRDYIAPYDEAKYLDIIKKFLAKFGVAHEQDLASVTKDPKLQRFISKDLIKELNSAKKASLDRYLRKKFTGCDKYKDGNCGPRAISYRLYGNSKDHQYIRTSVFEYAQQKLKLQDLDPMMCERGTIFTHRELQIAAEVYDFPIILFWYQNEMAFFDKLFNASTDHGKTRYPLYLLQLPHCYQRLTFKVKKQPKPQEKPQPVKVEEAIPIKATQNKETKQKVLKPVMKAVPMYPAPKKLSKNDAFGKIEAKTKKHFNYGSMKNIVAPQNKVKFLEVESIREELDESGTVPIQQLAKINKDLQDDDDDVMAQVRDFPNMKDLQDDVEDVYYIDFKDKNSSRKKNNLIQAKSRVTKQVASKKPHARDLIQKESFVEENHRRIAQIIAQKQEQKALDEMREKEQILGKVKSKVQEQMTRQVAGTYPETMGPSQPKKFKTMEEYMVYQDALKNSKESKR